MDKNGYKEIVAQQMAEISELKEKVKELETELYFTTRNNKMEQIVDEKQMDLFDSYARKLKPEDLKWIKEYCGKTPFIVKGILSTNDARLVLKNGADVVWISNHGGRMLESSFASLKALVEIKKNHLLNLLIN